MESALAVRRPTDLRQQKYDEVSTALAYLGFAAPDAVTSDAAWMIQKVVFGPAGSVGVAFANGNAEYVNVWDNRASLTYSI